ncbi:hypothetical protein BDV30DRAFT_230239 [Aspergillus minisclerotigenes]|uniref:S-adenosyl-L-methionine-dependent methyltransferase n=1 Tax=Aspergillus minisclerotigenes TaxID=656917 RepID=A0A5N6IST6_9EURO|nr:hypothetical protein BDV30DRAFT_230239 [Aspergillus minisclerotigenes]
MGNYDCTWEYLKAHIYIQYSSLPLVDLYEYLLHPSIPLQAPNLEIADVGTGTGLNLSRRLPPSVQLDGFDISFEAVPTQEWLPPNMKLIHWDGKTDVPKETEGRYDVMHLRHFIFVLLAEEIKYTLEKLLKLLSPDSRLRSTWLSDLPSLFAGCGFEAIHTDVRDAPSYLMTAMHECKLVMHENFIRKTKDEAGAGKVERTHAANI